MLIFTAHRPDCRRLIGIEAQAFTFDREAAAPVMPVWLMLM